MAARDRFGRRSPDLIERVRELVTEQFNNNAPGNDLRWALIHPNEGPDGYYWGPADQFVEIGERHNTYIVGHTLVWHSQTPFWVFTGDGSSEDGLEADGRTGPEGDTDGPWRRRVRRPRFRGPRATREQLLTRMREHIHTVVGRYRGEIRAWGVVNEAYSDRGDAVLREWLWLYISGPDCIAKAFQYAREADHDAGPRYNDYGLEDLAKRRKLIKFAQSLQAEGASAMAIGTQSNLNASSDSLENMDQTLTELEIPGLPINVTELDFNSARRGHRDSSADISGNAAATDGGLVDAADGYEGGQGLREAPGEARCRDVWGRQRRQLLATQEGALALRRG